MDASYNGTGGFNNGGNVSQPVSYGSGDIILASENKKGRLGGRKVILGIIVGLLVIVIAVFAGIMLPHAFVDSFDEYKKLVLYGNDGETYPNERGSYAIQTITGNRDKEKVADYFAKVRKAAEKVDEKTKEKFGRDMEVIDLWMKIYYFFHFLDDDMIKVFEENGDSATRKYIMSEYGRFRNTSDEEIAAVGGVLTNAAFAYLDYIVAFEANGCKLSDITEACESRDSDLDYDIFEDALDKASDAYESGIWVMLKKSVNNIASEKK